MEFLFPSAGSDFRQCDRVVMAALPQKDLADMKICLSTCPHAQADRLVETLLSERLAACVNIVGPVRSHYWWDGKIQIDHEALLVIKTSAARVPELMFRLRTIHPYNVPEIVILPVETAFEGYLDWVAQQTAAETSTSL